jgi:MSHA pilin protein MshA
MLFNINEMEFLTKVKVLMDTTMTLKQPNIKAQGFTLIELIVVIVILGILAATVAPKYIDLTSDAHTATLEAVKGSLEGASALVYSKSIVAGNQSKSQSDTPAPSIILADGSSLNIHYGYPQALVDDWERLIDIDGDVFSLTVGFDGALIIYRKDREGVVPITSGFECITYYKSVFISGDSPEIETSPCS